MKIRIKGNSVRVRLSKSEVELFAKEGYVEERTEFENSTLIYAVKSKHDGTMSADFTSGNLTLFVPADLLKQWSSTDLVGIDHNMLLNNGKYLYILLEKDFKCIDAAVTEDQSDYFENPLKVC
ncbi:DUF7009 family protein [Segetibacter koreensis]|uniref:DUF7009 family protein n=1 Tax=Segetibacter koreensis TaxID=398037 RepID=UPI000364152D|nr:hypothetical protein [Segetibacter koreensis]